jgi:hypothetical protein
MRVRLSGDPESVAALSSMLHRADRGVVCVDGRADYALTLRMGSYRYAQLDGIHSTFEAELAQQLTDQRAMPPGVRVLEIVIRDDKGDGRSGTITFAEVNREIVVRSCYRALMTHATRNPAPKRPWWKFKLWIILGLAATSACAPVVRVEAPRPLPDFAKALALKCMGEAIALDVYMAGFPLMHSTERIEMLAALELSACSPEAIAYRRARQAAPSPNTTPKGSDK